MSMIVPIAKSSDMSNTAKYRPISLTCICGKVLGKYIRQLIHEHLQGFNLLQTTSIVLALADWFSHWRKAKRSVLCSLTIKRP